ncbi:hypothetical protein [Coraliomargarita parva]|uniref:hypothetical protein n=1 Tax=Coraliomargarita parva TaxID=3014050 RepID=UPI0022B41D8B|nr:hypothetical protein [Coraliomargarita parva]
MKQVINILGFVVGGTPTALLLFASLMLSGCTDYAINTADTVANRDGFKAHFGFEPGPDVSALYYYADEFGADVRYQLAFRCPKPFADEIIRELKLMPSPANYSGLKPRDDLEWWLPSSTRDLPMWIHTPEKARYFREFWYSEAEGRAYYQEYSI